MRGCAYIDRVHTLIIECRPNKRVQCPENCLQRASVILSRLVVGEAQNDYARSRKPAARSPIHISPCPEGGENRKLYPYPTESTSGVFCQTRRSECEAASVSGVRLPFKSFPALFSFFHFPSFLVYIYIHVHTYQWVVFILFTHHSSILRPAAGSIEDYWMRSHQAMGKLFPTNPILHQHLSHKPDVLEAPILFNNPTRYPNQTPLLGSKLSR